MALSARSADESDIKNIVRRHGHEHVRELLNPPTGDDVRSTFPRPNLAQYLTWTDEALEGLLLLSYRADWMVEIPRRVVARPGRGIGGFALEWPFDHAFKQRNADRIYPEVAAGNMRAGYSKQNAMRRSRWRRNAQGADATT